MNKFFLIIHIYINIKMSFLRFFIVISCVINIFSKIIQIPFKVIENNNKKSFIENLMTINILSEIKIGDPLQQEMDIHINFNHYYLYFSNKSIYDEKKSKAYEKLSDSKQYYFEPIKTGILSRDDIKIGNIHSKMNYILATEGENYIKKCSIGLKPTYEQKEKDNANIITYLKSTKEINSYTFTIIFNEKKNNIQTGEIIIGEFPHEYNKDQYKIEYYQKMNIDKSQTLLYWGIKIDEIKLNKNRLYCDSYLITFDIELGVFYGARSYYYEINETFFDEAIRYEECRIEIVKDEQNNEYDYYVCNKNAKFSLVPDLIFFYNENRNNFTFTYKDLFIQNGDEYYFLFLFNRDRSKNYNWVFGKRFMEKYHFVFDQDKFTIGFYTKILPKKINFWKYILFIILGIIIFSFGIILGYLLIKKPRKKRANELLEEYDYSPNSINL